MILYIHLIIKHAADAFNDEVICCSINVSIQFKTNDLGNICHEHLEYYSYKFLNIYLKKMV